ncbi:hypothetical protein ACFFX0_06670 [Citricoccus parietis]|uniref:Uncharacterized protein n=1 Tax=Citricoccus parietis TaxID=592307 RepID=A0ABV5FW29_9MICC
MRVRLLAALVRGDPRPCDPQTLVPCRHHGQGGRGRRDHARAGCQVMGFHDRDSAGGGVPLGPTGRGPGFAGGGLGPVLFGDGTAPALGGQVELAHEPLGERRAGQPGDPHRLR